MLTSRQKSNLALAAIAGTLLLTGAVAWFLDLHEIGPGLVRSWGVAGMIGYALLIMLLGGLGVPPVLFIVPAVAFWPLPIALAVSLCGGLGASVVGFFLSRYCLRETVEPRIPEKIARYEHRLETHGFSTVLVLRLLFYLFPPINWMLGISAIPLPVFTAATLLGIIPGTVAYTLTGKGALAFVKGLGLLQGAGLIGLTAAGLWLWFRWATGDSPSDPPDDIGD
jgi:uncharacterized membrane protein YdjX (TVP38/TMEM64 family)